MTTSVAQPSINVVTTVGVTNSQDGVLPIASLFSSSDIGQPSTTTVATKSASTSAVPMKRAISCYQPEQNKESITT